MTQAGTILRISGNNLSQTVTVEVARSPALSHLEVERRRLIEENASIDESDELLGLHSVKQNEKSVGSLGSVEAGERLFQRRRHRHLIFQSDQF